MYLNNNIFYEIFEQKHRYFPSKSKNKNSAEMEFKINIIRTYPENFKAIGEKLRKKIQFEYEKNVILRKMQNLRLTEIHDGIKLKALFES